MSTKNKIDQAYKFYTEKTKFDSSGKWSKPIQNEDNKYYHPEPYTKEEFIEKVINDDDFNEEWGKDITRVLSEGERVNIWVKNNPNHPPNTPIRRSKLYEETPKRKIKE